MGQLGAALGDLGVHHVAALVAHLRQHVGGMAGRFLVDAAAGGAIHPPIERMIGGAVGADVARKRGGLADAVDDLRGGELRASIHG